MLTVLGFTLIYTPLNLIFGSSGFRHYYYLQVVIQTWLLRFHQKFIIIRLFHDFLFLSVFKSICSSLFKMHSVKYKYNSIALFLFLLILYESLVHARFDFEHEMNKKDDEEDVPFPSPLFIIDCDRCIKTRIIHTHTHIYIDLRLMLRMILQKTKGTFN